MHHIIVIDKKISIIVPVLNESEIINQFLADIKNICNDEDCEIIVVDGDENRGTINNMNDANVITLVSKKGRSSQMNAGASIAKGQILLFVHADTSIPKDALNIIYGTLVGSKYVGGAFKLGFNTKNILLKFIAFTANIRTKITRIPYGDQAIFILKKYFDNIGGFKDIPLMEDIELIKRIKKLGGKICILEKEVITSPRRWYKNGIIFNTLRNHVLRILYSLGISAKTLEKIYK